MLSVFSTLIHSLKTLQTPLFTSLIPSLIDSTEKFNYSFHLLKPENNEKRLGVIPQPFVTMVVFTVYVVYKDRSI